MFMNMVNGLAGRVYNCLENIHPGLTHKVVGGVVTSAALSYVAVRGYRYYRSCQIVKKRGQAGKQACENLKRYLEQQEAEYGLVDREKEAMIISLGLKELTEKLRKGELKAVEVLRAYQRKAMDVNDELNCVTEPIKEAEERAVELDSLPPDQRGPLHGVPVSIKECIWIQGYDCHAGLSALANIPMEKDADIVKFLKNLGAVPFVRTNIPQGVISYACSNPIYGRTHNPHNVCRGPGGSSGGEGALIGGGGSIIGIGSDLGGSIRIPCQMCGSYGLKPTVDRFVNVGEIALGEGQTLVRATLGPMTRDLDSLIMLSKLLLSPQMHDIDATVPPLDFNDELFEKEGPLRIGYYTSLEGISAHPGCVRAVLEAKAALERKGHKMVQFKPPKVYTTIELMIDVIYGDDGEDAGEYLKDDVWDDCVKVSFYTSMLPRCVLYVLAKLICLVDPQNGRVPTEQSNLPRTVFDWWSLEEKIQEYKREFMEAWKSQKLDAVICPGFPTPAITSGCENNAFVAIMYTAVYNLLNYPAGIMRVGAVKEQDVQRLKDPAAYPRNGAIEKFVIQDSEGTVGLPLAVQCVALPYQEEMVLRVMKDIDTGIRK